MDFNKFCSEVLKLNPKIRFAGVYSTVNGNIWYKMQEGISPNTKSCEECEKEHLPVVALRMCLTCGHVGCCDSSIGKHATKHFQETGHPVMKAIPGDIWKWCYLHEEYY